MSQRILLVEDDFFVRSSVKALLEDPTCQVIEAENGEVALEMIQGGLNPNIIVSDVEMPKMTGFGLLAAIKSYNIPVIIMSGRSRDKNTNFDFETYAINNGAAAFMYKPPDPEALFKMIEKYARPS